MINTNNTIPDWLLQNKAAVRETLARFRGKKILVVGDLILDEFIWGEVSRISPEAPVPVVWVKKQSFMPGGASNVAHNLHALGAQVLLAGAVGSDSSGDILLAELQKMGVETSGVVRIPARPTTHKIRVIAHSQQVVRIDKEEIDSFSATAAKKLKERILENIKEAHAVIIEDYGKGLITSGLVKFLVELGKKNKKIISVDPKKEHFRFYRGITTITPNKNETEKAVGFEIKDDRTLLRAGSRLLVRLDAKSVLLTLGDRGMCLFRKGKQALHIPTMARQVYDVSGAGDTVIAAFTLALTAGATLPQASYIANQAAGIVVGKIGIATVSEKELWQEIKRWK